MAGGIAGLANATFCYLKWPVAVDTQFPFHWHIIPAGLIHGSALAALAVAAGRLGSKLTWSPRWSLALPVGWIAGYASWIPLDLSAFDAPLSGAVLWPIAGSDPWFIKAYSPVTCFGAVATLLYLWVAHSPKPQGPGKAILAASTAGVLGSLWFWIAFERWYFSLLHGVV